MKVIVETQWVQPKFTSTEPSKYILVLTAEGVYVEIQELEKRLKKIFSLWCLLTKSQQKEE